MVRQMYIPAEFSPDMSLQASVGVDDTTITLNTAAYAPPPPNIGIFNDPAYPEVFLYTTRTATTLGGLVRGVSKNGDMGAAHAHDAGIAVYCGDTAYAKAAEVENIRYMFAQQAIGVEWNSAAPDTTKLTLIDLNGDPITSLPFGSFDAHRTYREIRRCLLSTTGTPTFGANPRGDGLTLDGSRGRVMVSIPKFWVKADSPGVGRYRWWISPFPISGFEVHPAFRQRSGMERETIYVSAYLANLLFRDYPVHASTTVALHSRTGEQPVTGDGAIKRVTFTSGSKAPVVGETLTDTETGATGIVVDWNVTSGTWSAGNAAGSLLLRQVTGSFESSFSDVLNGSVGGANMMVALLQFPLNLTIADARASAEAIGAGWGLMNIWTWAAVQLLAMIEHQTTNFQSAIGRGICDLPEDVFPYTEFDGKINGADAADQMIGANGTGAGTGANGQTPVVWRGLENLWGNAAQMLDGITCERSDLKVRLSPRSGTVPVSLPVSNSEMSIGELPSTSGVVSKLNFEPLLRYLFLPSEVAGSAGTHFCDPFTSPYNAFAYPFVIACAGGEWDAGDDAGLFRLHMHNDERYNAADIGCRLEYIGPEGASPTTATVTPGGGGTPISVPAPVTITTASPPVSGVDPSTPQPVQTNPSTPNSDPPVQVVPVQTPGQIITGDGGVTTAFNTGYGWSIDGAGTSWQLAFSGGYFMTNMSSQWPVWTERYDGDAVAQVFGVTPLTSIGYWVSRGETSMYGPSNWVSQGIPPGATVTGITVKRYGRYSGLEPAIGTDLVMQVCVHDQAGTKHVSANKAKLNTNWGYGPHDNNDQTKYLRVYGGPTDLWGLDPSVLTPENLNARGIEVDFQLESRAGAGGTGTPGRFYLYAIFVEITFEV